MEGIIPGTTPFEKVTAGRVKSQKLMATHLAVVELMKQIEECDLQIAAWQDTVLLYNEGKATKDMLEAELTIAAEALKDKKAYEAALVTICEVAGMELGLDA